MIQLFIPSRDTSALDLATNVAGSILGVFLALMTEDVFLQRRALAAARNVRKSSRLPDPGCSRLCWSAGSCGSGFRFFR